MKVHSASLPDHPAQSISRRELTRAKRERERDRERFSRKQSESTELLAVLLSPCPPPAASYAQPTVRSHVCPILFFVAPAGRLAAPPFAFLSPAVKAPSREPMKVFSLCSSVVPMPFREPCGRSVALQTCHGKEWRSSIIGSRGVCTPPNLFPQSLRCVCWV